jgi:ABC-type antimicrobial peptide transport system permease subunit
MQVALRGLWGRKLRTVLTALSIILGTSMITGTFVLRAQIDNAFSSIFHESNKGIDVVLSKKTAFTSDNGATAGPLPESVIGIARGVDGVKRAEGQIQATGSIVIDGKYVTGSGGAPNLVFSYVTEPFSNSQFTSGGPPSEGSVAVNKKLADDEHLTVGQHIAIATDKGVAPVTVSGIFKLAGVSSIGGATLVVPTFKDAQRWFDRVGRTSVVYLQADPGITPDELKNRVEAAVPSDVKVQTGQQNADEQTSDVESSTNFLTYALLAFAGAAVFVGLFIIFNTYSITVAQRIREFAMLRTLGASRRQVLRSVLVEAALMGLVASLLGIGFGILLAIGLNALFTAVGVDLPTAALSIPILTAVLLPLAVGIGAALIASVAPAIRATRVPPIAALREGFVLPPGRLSPYTPYIGLTAALIGIGLIAYAIRAGGGGSRVLLTMAAGAVIAFLGVAMLSRILISPLAAVLGVALEALLRIWRFLGRVRDRIPLLGKLLRRIGYGLTLGCVWIGAITLLIIAAILKGAGAGTGGLVGAVIVLAIGGSLTAFLLLRRPREWPWDPSSPTAGRLARENTARNPGRTAVTAAALMIGVALIVFVATFVNGFKDSFLGAIDRSITSDLIVQGQNFGSVPTAAVDAANKVPGVRTASGLQFTEAKINNGGTDTVNGVNPQTFPEVYRFDWLNGGSNALLRNLGPRQALIEQQFAKSHDLSTGDRFTLTSIDGNKLRLSVAGEYKDPNLMTGLIITTNTFDRFSPGNKDPGIVLIEFDQGPQGAHAQAAITHALKSFPGVKVQTNAEYKKSAEDFVNGLLQFLYVLLAMCLIISLIGIVNTLALSVFERTREIGTLRAVGMTRRQLRRVIRYESTITAIIGGLFGIAVGLLFGWIVAQGLADQGLVFVVPYSQLFTFLIVAMVFGVLAAILPARRAAKLNVLEALQYE